VLANALFHVNQAAQLLDEPRIILGAFVDLLVAGPEPHALGDLEQAVRRGPRHGAAEHVLVLVLAVAFQLDLVEAGQSGFQAAQGFCRDSWKVRPMAMTSPTDFMAVVRLSCEPGNFSNAKRGILVTT
jgi:hypothetical protein